MRVVRSDSGVAHRLSLSARVLSAVGWPSQGETTREEALLAPAESRAPRSGESSKQAAAGRDARIAKYYPGIIGPSISEIGSKAGVEAKGLFAFPGAMMGFPSRDLAHEIHRHCDRRRRPCRLDRGRHARPRRHFRDSDRPASGLSARLSRRKTQRLEQVERFRKTGIAEAALRAATHDGENWIARFGYLLDKTAEPAIRHHVRRAGQRHPRRDSAGVESIFSQGRSRFRPAPERQKIVLSNGEEISARLVVLANGLNVGLRHQLGIERRIVSACHSISLGFDIAPVGRAGLRLSGADLFLGAAERPDSLSDAVSDREQDAGQPVRLSPDRRSLAAANAPRAGADAERLAAEAAHGSPANSRSPATSRSGPPTSMSAPVIASPAWFWSATPSRPPARSPGPAPTRCSPTSNGSATSIFRPGSRPTAWTRPRSRRSTTIRSRPPATPGRARRPTISARCRSTTASTGRRSAGRVSWRGSAKEHCGSCARPARRRSRKFQRSILVVVIVIVAVVVGLTGSRMRLVALVVPELAIDAVGGEQLGVRAALDRLAA